MRENDRNTTPMTPDEMLADWADSTEGLGDGHRSVKIEPSGSGGWALWLTETRENARGSADWITRDWVVYGDSIADVVAAATEGGLP